VYVPQLGSNDIEKEEFLTGSHLKTGQSSYGRKGVHMVHCNVRVGDGDGCENETGINSEGGRIVKDKTTNLCIKHTWITGNLRDFKFSQRRVLSSESSGMYCHVLNWISTDVSEVRGGSLIRGL
jgi:hypothetical protein